jgi:hypothetical protein
MMNEPPKSWSFSACNDNPAVALVAKPSDVPHWPRRMKLPMAAAYADESISKFQKGVKAGKWPRGHRDGGNVYWFLEDLDAALDRLKRTTGAAVGWEDYINDAA